jgi:hypothetical protein
LRQYNRRSITGSNVDAGNTEEEEALIVVVVVVRGAGGAVTICTRRPDAPFNGRACRTNKYVPIVIKTMAGTRIDTKTTRELIVVVQL